MQYTTTTSQNNFFHSHGWIYFENFFKEGTIDELIATIKGSFVSHDLWKEFPYLKKMISKEVCPTMLDLLNKPIVRLAYDHYYNTRAVPKDNNLLHADEHCLEELTSYQNLNGGVIIPLSDAEGPSPILGDKKVFSWTKGDAFFFLADKQMNFSQLLQCEPHLQFIVIGFGGLSIVYKQNETDPQRDYLRKLGYSPGDKLSDTTHPCFRKKR